MTRARPACGWIAVAICGALLAGCASGPRLFVNSQADMTLYKRVVVAPFGNLTGDPYAAARVTRAFTTELVIADRFELVDPALLLGELERAGARADNTGQFEIDKVRTAATALKATAIIRGTVTEYTTRRSGNDDYPVLSFDCEMVDVQTGTLIWRLSTSRSGKGRVPLVGGSGERTFSRLTEEACQHAVSVLKDKAL